MKLAFIRQRYNPFGGAERFVERALAALSAQQATHITMIARQWDAGDAGDTDPSAASKHAPGGVEWERCNPFYLGRVWRDRGFARAVCGRVAPGRFDLVQSHERVACGDIYRAGDGVHRQWLAHRARQQSALAQWLTGVSPYHRYVLEAERRTFANPRLRAVICNSQLVRDDIRRHFRIAPEKLHVIYNGLDLEYFHPRLRDTERASMRATLGVRASEYVYLFVGSGFERKGVERVLEALVRTRASRLVVVGRDGRLIPMQRRAAALGLADRVHFAGGQNDVRPYLAAADCFVLPTLYDPMPNAALEALACGLPVITSTQSGAAELIREGVNGYVRDALDVAGLAGAMDMVRALDAQTSLAAARAAVAALGIDTMAARLLELYRSLLAPTQTPASR